MEITTSAKISTPGFKTFQQPCVGEFLSKQFQVIMQLSGTQLKHYQLSKASKFCYQCSIFKTGSPLGVRWESSGSLLWVLWESSGSPLGVHWEYAGSPLGVRWEYARSPPGVHRESAGSPPLFEFWWLSVGSLISPRNTITFQSSFLNRFSKLALKIGSQKEFAWSPMGVHCTSLFY